jgi:hypothetical protein
MSPLLKGAMLCVEQDYRGQTVERLTASYFVFLNLSWRMRVGHGV